MRYNILRSHERGEMDIGWLDAKYSFSFSRYYNPDRLGFGALKVLNNDVIKPGAGFDTHCHSNFEIITIPLRGAVKHKDDKGNEGVVSTGEVQVMSAGTGICHSEHNASVTEELELFQIWIETDSPDVTPRYEQKNIKEVGKNMPQLIVAGMNSLTDSVAKIYQDVSIYVLDLESQSEYVHAMKDNGKGLFVIAVEGGVNINEHSLDKRDSIEIFAGPDEGMQSVSLKNKSKDNTSLLMIEVPIRQREVQD